MFVKPAAMVGGGVFERERSEPFMMPLHKHDHMSEMYFVEKGEGEFGIDGRTYRAVPGTLMFYQRGVWHEELSTVHPFTGMYIGFRGLELRGLPPCHFVAPEQPPVFQLGEQAASFASRFRRCIAEFDSGEPEARTVASHLLGALLGRLARTVHYRDAEGPAAKPSQMAVMNARRYIEENYAEQITLAKLSRAAYVNEYYLAHLFKQELGVSPIQFLKMYRIEVAKRLLSTSGVSNREISEQVGYQSETTFQNTFKKMTGMTPGEYRRSRLER
ncbi:helix-turn-helix domain-containing protein [Cohnella zeiphila]|uniref:AraC family transcriptional regulator n=1 Tax=Cohnella zeiphila TaxID=2761120 RepID=A0A7X0SN84_9BACL|nr:AraC family transcriptional regulator [Cohnella zeiphila]MBB6732941.1 AraC family transcriptional regulator [Cohnella zeiphila]